MLRAIRDAQRRFCPKSRVPAYDVAARHCLLGDWQQALRLLETSVEIHKVQVTDIRADKNFDSLDNDRLASFAA